MKKGTCMIINIDIFKETENIINQAQDKLNGEIAMRYMISNLQSEYGGIEGDDQ